MSGSQAVLVTLACALLLYNLFANRWPPFNGPWYVPLNLAVTCLVVLAGLGPLGLTWREIAGTPESLGFVVGAIAGLVVTAPLLVGTLWGRSARLIRDERVAHLGGWALAYQTLIRIPLGTALLEEVAFRGVLFAGWRHLGDIQAALLSSLVFGLWHVGPTINMVRMNRPGASSGGVVRTVAGAVLFTTLAGLLFVWLRIEWGLGAPLLMHATVNSVATVASVLAHRRLVAVSAPR